MLITHGQTLWKWKGYCFVIEKVGSRCLPTSSCNTSLLVLIRYEFWRYFFVNAVHRAFLPFWWILMFCLSSLPEANDKVTMYNSFHNSFNSEYWVNKSSLCCLCSLRKLCRINNFVMVYIRFDKRLLGDVFNQINCNINMYIVGSVALFSASSLKWHCHVSTPST